MYRKLAVAGLGLALTVSGADPSRTEHMDFPAGGTLRLQNSVGELVVEGWDQPGVEITTTKSALYEKEQRDLDRVQISTKRQGDELVVTTEYPSHRAFPYVTTLDHVTHFNIEYHIKVPRNARLVINHGDGEVHITDVAGNIEVTSRQGLIALLLTGDVPRSIDAKSAIGSVNSDFPGTETTQKLFIGHKFLQSTAGTSQNLKLRVRYGDIVIQKAWQPEAPSSAPQK
jgi:hypothetical protein